MKPKPYEHQVRPMSEVLRAWLSALPEHTYVVSFRQFEDGRDRTIARPVTEREARRFAKRHHLSLPGCVGQASPKTAVTGEKESVS